MKPIDIARQGSVKMETTLNYEGKGKFFVNISLNGLKRETNQYCFIPQTFGLQLNLIS